MATVIRKPGEFALLKVTGYSKNEYDFILQYDLRKNSLQFIKSDISNVGGIFLFSQETTNKDHRVLFIGFTDDFSRTFNDPNGLEIDMILNQKPTHLSFLITYEEEHILRGMVKDIMNNYNEYWE